MPMDYDYQLVDVTETFTANTNSGRSQIHQDVLGLSNGGLVVAHLSYDEHF